MTLLGAWPSWCALCVGRLRSAFHFWLRRLPLLMRRRVSPQATHTHQALATSEGATAVLQRILQANARAQWARVGSSADNVLAPSASAASLAESDGAGPSNAASEPSRPPRAQSTAGVGAAGVSAAGGGGAGGGGGGGAAGVLERRLRDALPGLCSRALEVLIGDLRGGAGGGGGGAANGQ